MKQIVLVALAAFLTGSVAMEMHAQAAAAPAEKPKTVCLTEVEEGSWEAGYQKQLKTDWPWLGRFAAENKALPAPQAGENRVVFLGDSITEGWHLDKFFPGKPYVNRGISGQTTPQMVLRFKQDVVALKPKVVVILAGTNDLAGNTGKETNEQIFAYLTTLSDLAHAHGIKVIFESILPVYDYPWRPGLEPSKKIIEINDWLKKYAAEHGDAFVDYHSAMKDERDGLPKNLAEDGVHPTAAGYAVMAPLVEAAIEKAVK